VEGGLVGVLTLNGDIVGVSFWLIIGDELD